jgi:hypothetical protein
LICTLPTSPTPSRLLSWLVTATPISTDEGKAAVVEPIVVQLVPLTETDAVTVDPVRRSLIHDGGECLLAHCHVPA